MSHPSFSRPNVFSQTSATREGELTSSLICRRKDDGSGVAVVAALQRVAGEVPVSAIQLSHLARSTEPAIGLHSSAKVTNNHAPRSLNQRRWCRRRRRRDVHAVAGEVLVRGIQLSHLVRSTGHVRVDVSNDQM